MVGNAKDSRLLASLPGKGLFLCKIAIPLRYLCGKLSTLRLRMEQFVALLVPLTGHKPAKLGEHGE
jgi:hypothetical protein